MTLRIREFRLQPADLIKTAKLLAKASRGKPSQANLRRAASSAYYALFHCLAKTCADLLLGGSNAQRGERAWRQAYRALEHRNAKNACRNGAIVAKFPKEIEDFANLFVTLQEKRHLADYDPHARFLKSSVLSDVALAEQALKDFVAQPLKDRRAFCVHVLFKHRPS